MRAILFVLSILVAALVVTGVVVSDILEVRSKERRERWADCPGDGPHGTVEGSAQND